MIICGQHIIYVTYSEYKLINNPHHPTVDYMSRDMTYLSLRLPNSPSPGHYHPTRTHKMSEPNPASSDPPAPVVQFKKRVPKAKAIARKAPSGDSSDSASSSDSEKDITVKKRKTNASAIASSSASAHQKSKDTATPGSTGSKPSLSNQNDATKQTDWFDHVDNDNDDNKAKQLLGSTRPLQKDSDRTQDGSYKGLANQTSFIQRNPNAAPKKSFGPVKASTNVRMTTFFDYKPDVCKDYKLTGFCGFGDSCVFLHDRGDYKQGWELDREWENVTKGGKKVDGTIVSRRDDKKKTGRAERDADDDDDMPEDIPFACIICQGPYKEPVVTKCGHYFCEMCALNRYKKDPSCAACGAGTGGVFNTAKKLKQILEKRRKRNEEEEEEEEE